MHRHVLTGDVFEDPVVRRRRAPHVVFRLETVDRDHDLELGHVGPRRRDRPNGAGHDLRVHAHGRELRQQDVELPESHERLAADDREVDRPLFAHDAEHAVNQRLTFEVGEVTKHDSATQMGVAVGVAAWTPKGAFTCDFDREVGTIATENLAPRTDNVFGFHDAALILSPMLSPPTTRVRVSRALKSPPGPATVVSTPKS